MNKLMKYSSILLLFSILLLMASSLVAAAEINDTLNNDISRNTITNTVSDNANSISQSDNTEIKTMKEEVVTTYDITTSETKELIKNNKNLKESIRDGTVDATPNSGKAGDKITLHIFASGTSLSKTNYVYDITVKLNDTIFFTGTGSPNPAKNGYVDVIVPDFEPGEYTLDMEWNYDDGFRGARGTTPFTILVTTIDTKISEVDTVNGEVGNTIIPINVTDLNGNPINGSSTLTIKDEDNILIDNYAIEDGIASVAVPTIRAGNYDLTVLFNGNQVYVNSTTTIPVNVSKAATTLTVDQENDGTIHTIINPLENTVISGTLVQTSNNNPLENFPIKMTIDNDEYIVTTNNEGKYSFKYNITEISKNVTLSVAYEGNDLYLASQEYTGSFDIEGLEVTINLDDNPLSEVNETTIISGKVTNQHNKSVPNVEVNLDITGINDVVTVTTDSEGKFTYDVEYKDVMQVTVNASMKNQEIYKAENATMTFNVVVGPRRTNLTVETGQGVDKQIDITDITPYFNEVITNGTLIDIFGEPVANAKITILINNEDYSVYTDSEGIFNITYNATEGLTTYNLHIEFEGNDAYKPAEEVYIGTFTTEAFDITVTIDDNFPDEILINDEITISGNATLQNESLKNNPIVLTIDGKKYTTATDENGRYSYEYTTLRNGAIPIIANATFDNADVKVASKTMTVAYPIVNVDLDKVNDTTVLSEVTLNGRVYIAQNDTSIEDDLILKINGKNIPLASNEEGYFTYTFTPDTIGIYEISVSYNNKRYDVQNASTTFNVAKRATRLVNDKLPIAVKLTDVFKISGSLIDENNKTVEDAEVIFIINNERFTNTTDADGHYEYNYQTTEVCDNNIYEVRYSGDDRYVLAKNYVGSYFDVETFKANITIDATDCGIGDTTTITGTVKKSKEDPLSNVEVLIKINDEEYTTTTNDEGIYEYIYTPAKIGNYTVTATAVEFGQSTANTTFKVTKPTTHIIINPIKTTVNQETQIIANITTVNNSPVTGGKVAFKLNGKTIKDENGKVIYANVIDGKASIPYTFTLDNIQGNITAVYSGSTSYNGSRSEAIQAEIEQSQDEEPQLTGVATVNVEDITAIPGETITITATVKDGQVNIDEGKVVFKIAGKTVKDEKGKAIYVKVVDGKATLEYTIPTTYKVKDYTLKATYMSSIYDKTENESTLSIVKEKTNIQNGTQGLTNNNNGLKADGPTVHIINNDNVDQYITAAGLSDLVSPGDTLDIQGTIDKQHSLVINKPVNVISSTQDAIISLHTNAGSYFGEDPGNCFVVNKAGSGSNISNLYLYNTECWMFNNYDVTLYNMTMYVKDARVGSGVGQTAIRYCERMTIDSCNIYTENNDGSTSMALTGSSHILIKNTTINGVQGSGQVGNILYLGNRYNTGDKPSDFTLGVDNNITIVNCTLMGECTQAISVLIFYGQVNNVSYINNTFNATGYYAAIETRNGETVGNKFYQEARLTVNPGSNASDNAFYENSKLVVDRNTNIFNNTIALLEYKGNANLTNNTIQDIIMHSDTTLANQTVMGNVYLTAKKILPPAKITNTIIANNTIYGDIEIIGSSFSQRCADNLIINNSIGGNITITQAQRNSIKGNHINGSIIVSSNGLNTVITNNTIITDNEYAITTGTSANITDNYVISNNYQKIGNDAISDPSNKATITNNGPETTSEFWRVVINPVHATVEDNTRISVDIVDDIQGNLIDEGEVYLMVNDEILTDEDGNIIKAQVTSSQAIFEIENVAKDWLRSDAVLTAVYSNNDVTKINSTNMTISKREATVEITTEVLNITQGQTIKLTAKVTDNDELLTGQLAFKLNGCSLENEEGKLICVDVVDGIATLEYTFSDNIDSDTYTLSAVFENPYYNRSTDEKILVIE